MNDTSLVLAPLNGRSTVDHERRRARDVQLRFFLDTADPIMQIQPVTQQTAADLVLTAYPALFGGDPTNPPTSDEYPLPFGHGNGARVVRVPANPQGCQLYDPHSLPEDSVVLVHRGSCTFLEKLMNAAYSGASGVVVISDDDTPVNPSADQAEIAAEGALLDQVVAVVVTKKSGAEVTRMLDLAEARGFLELMVAVDPEGQSGVTDARESVDRKASERNQSEDRGRYLYLNGHPLLNTRLLV